MVNKRSRISGLFLLVTALAATQCTASSPPNIIVFIVDDMGWQDISVPFWDQRTPSNDLFRTPNMERLARSGLKFTRAYAATVCTPTRVSIMTGQNMARHRVTNWTMLPSRDESVENPDLLPPRWNLCGLQPIGSNIPRSVEAPTLPGLLNLAGYRALIVGKAHLGAVGTPGADPLSLGFDRNVGGHAAGSPGSYLGTNNFRQHFGSGDSVWDVPDLEQYYGKDIFLTEALTREALHLVDDAVQDKKPFFLYMSHYGVHTPYAPDKRFVKRYRDLGMSEANACYAAMIEGVDKSLGDLMDYLSERGLDNSTAIFFISDNGGVASLAGRPADANAPLRAGKGSFFEGGLRVPMLVRWPGHTQPESVTQIPMIVEDLYPTLVSVAGSQIPPDYLSSVDGIDLVPLLEGEATPDPVRPLLFHHPQQILSTSESGPFSALIQGKWKLVYRYDTREIRLYNLNHDINEANNLAEVQPERVSAMAETLARLLSERKAQTPLAKTDTILGGVTDRIVYQHGEICRFEYDSIVVHAGDELPFVVPGPSSSERNFEADAAASSDSADKSIGTADDETVRGSKSRR